VKRRVWPRRISAKAIQSGIEVAASPKLWMVSASNAVEPEMATITTWKSAVKPRPMSEIFSAQMPRSCVSMASSTFSWTSCECAKVCLSQPSTPPPWS
jgi:hypothetical protein